MQMTRARTTSGSCNNLGRIRSERLERLLNAFYFSTHCSCEPKTAQAETSCLLQHPSRKEVGLARVWGECDALCPCKGPNDSNKPHSLNGKSSCRTTLNRWQSLRRIQEEASAKQAPQDKARY